MQSHNFSVIIGGVKHNVAVLNLESSSAKKNPRTHRIQILDRSYSMAHALRSVVEQSQRSVDLMSQEDLLSTFWFSSPGEHGNVARGMRPGEDAKKLLSSMSTPIGSTCFSEVLQEVENAVVQYRDLVDQTVLDLFTDGVPVVPWSSETEKQRVFSIVDRIVSSGNVAAFNTIGYGNYYDPVFLNQISDASELGAFTHTSNIESFFNSLKHNISVSSEMVNGKTEVSCVDGEILYLTLKSARLSAYSLNLSRRSRSSNWIFVVSPNATSFVINGEKHALHGKKGALDVPEDIKQDFLYAYAAECFRKGERLKAVDIMANNLRDRRLAELCFNAFTVSEIGEAYNALAEAATPGTWGDEDPRYVHGKAGPGFMPAKNALCVMDVFQEMISSAQTVYYLPLQEGVPAYERIGRKAEDTENRFTPDTYDLRAPMGDFVWNKEKLNLSVRFRRQGTVSLNPRSAGAVKLPTSVPSFIWQSHSFVKDGNVNVKKAAFLLPEKLYRSMEERGVKMTSTLPREFATERIENERYVRVILDLSKLPIINRSYIDKSASVEDLYASTIAIKRLEAAQKVVKHVLDDVLKAYPSMQKTGVFSDFTVDQIRVLTEHGMRDDGNYGGVQKVVASVQDSDSYEARFIEFDLKGASSLPTIPDMMLMLDGKKKVNLPGSYMVEAWNVLQESVDKQGMRIYQPSTQLRDALEAQLGIIKKQLLAERNTLNVLKMAKVLTGDGFAGLTPNEKGQLEFSRGGSSETMLIKMERKPVPIDATE